MLLAKIKDKLFNRRNSVEILSLQGDVEVDGNVSAKNLKSTYVVEDVKNISETILFKLKAGDLVIKQDSSGNHTYVVSFNKDNTGLCLTYTDASLVETQSYDYTGGHWVYNSEDKMPLVDVESASSGTIVDALGLDSDGKLVKGAVSGGTKLYKHTLTMSSGNYIIFISPDSSDWSNTLGNISESKFQNSLHVPEAKVGTTKIHDIIGFKGITPYFYVFSVEADTSILKTQFGGFSVQFTDTVTEL